MTAILMYICDLQKRDIHPFHPSPFAIYIIPMLQDYDYDNDYEYEYDLDEYQSLTVSARCHTHIVHVSASSSVHAVS